MGANVIPECAGIGVAEVERAVGPVAEGPEEGAGGVGERSDGEVPEGGLDGLPLVGGGYWGKGWEMKDEG